MRRTSRILWYVLTLRCEEADRVRCLRAEGGAARHELVAERLHRALCRSCRAAQRQVRDLDEALAELRDRAADQVNGGEVALSDASKARLRDAVAVARTNQNKNS